MRWDKSNIYGITSVNVALDERPDSDLFGQFGDCYEIDHNLAEIRSLVTLSHFPPSKPCVNSTLVPA